MRIGRRTFLTSAGLLGVTSTAGCLDFLPGNDAPPEDDESPPDTLPTSVSLEPPQLGETGVTVALFSDIHSEAAREVYQYVFRDLSQHIESGDICIQHRDYIDAETNGKAALATMRFVQDEYGDQKFWDLTSLLTEQYGTITAESLPELAHNINIEDSQPLIDAMTDEEYLNFVQNQHANAQENGVTYLPSVRVNEQEPQPATPQNIESQLQIAGVDVTL